MLGNLRFEPQLDLQVSNQLRAWKRVLEDPALGVPSPRILGEDSEIFVIGSCFANEIRAVLETADIYVHPRIDSRIAELLPESLKIDPAWGIWDERVHYQCYTPFSILQEVRIAMGAWSPSPKALITTKKDGVKHVWDPYRRFIHTPSAEATLEVRETMSQRLRDGIESSDVLIFTLGLIESFGLVDHEGVSAEFNLAYRKKLTFHDPGYAEALGAIDEACTLILERYSEKHIVLTVSPIPLSRTFTEDDVVTASVRGKSILRAVADTVIRKHTNVHYFPSYEYVMWRGDAFREDDLRHVKPDVVAQITRAFCDAWFQKGALQVDAARYPDCAPSTVQAPEALKRYGILDTLLGRRPAAETRPMTITSSRSVSTKTEKYFKKQLKGLTLRFHGLLAGDGVTSRHGSGSKDQYEVYGDREMREYETESCTGMRDGEVLDLTFKEIRDAYIAPIEVAIEDLSAGLDRPLRVLEVGCGNGTNLMLLTQRCGSQAIFSGIDIAAGRIREGQKYWGERLEGVDLRAASATDLSCFEDQSFDIVYSICALEQITYRLHEAVREMVRLAAQRIVCVEPIPQFGNEAQRLYNIVNDQCRTLLPELEMLCADVVRHGILPTLHNPLNPVGHVVATP